MAGQGMAFLRAGRKYGIDPRLLVGIATIESGAGAHMRLAYNPFNWSVHQGKTYRSWEESIMDVARGLRRGYLDQGLTTPQQIVSKYAPSSDGNDEANWAKVVGQVMNQLGGANPLSPPAGTGSGAGTVVPPAASPLLSSPQAPPIPQLDLTALSRGIRDQFVLGKGKIDLTGLPSLVKSSYVTPVQPQATPTVPGADPTVVTAGQMPPPDPAQGPVSVNSPGGGWGGSRSVAEGFRDIARKFGLSVMSEKRDTRNTASGGVSDHWSGNKTAYAFDLSNGSSPTPEMDRAAIAIMRALGVAYDGKSELVRNVNVNGYRVQVIYRSNVGGNHFNHIHVGVRKL